MAQCEEGHLVCVDCFKSYVQEKLFGSGKIKLECMTSECSSIYPGSELQRCLEPKVWSKYEERFMEENLNMAGVARELIRCSSCNFAALLSPSVKMFRCLREDCQKAVCRDCGVDWNNHIGLDCKEVENKDESLRLEYEEKMTKAKVRTCESCNSQFTKESGCNKIICRCGATMCYICRTSNINYSHYCNHPRDPGNGCYVCNACSLWTNPEEDERRAIKEIKNEAMSKRKALGYNDNKVIGVPDEQAMEIKHDNAKMMIQPFQNQHQRQNQPLGAQVPEQNPNLNMHPPVPNQLPEQMQNHLPEQNLNPNLQPPMQNLQPPMQNLEQNGRMVHVFFNYLNARPVLMQ
ncbi:unnamed protein product [Lymnaea stagnalis]|uniref:RING-type domain-containing protein n=1 Tax=Lymnaea stagnalis TaxID=6523 RepID=A0AAV2H862_LYMST